MQIKSITYRRAIKVNLGNFENTDLMVEMTMDVSDHLTYSEHMDRLSEMVHHALQEQLVKALDIDVEDAADRIRKAAEKKVKRYGI